MKIAVGGVWSHMRRLVRALILAAALAVLAMGASGCGSSGSKAASRPEKPRHLFSLVGFDLKPGHPSRVSFALDGSTLLIVAYVRGRGPAPGVDPEPTCRLERVDGSRLVPVELDEDEQVGARYWIYTAQATSPLTAGTYRLTLTGDGVLHPFSATQL
jgi:hypothetical protein